MYKNVFTLAAFCVAFSLFSYNVSVQNNSKHEVKVDVRCYPGTESTISSGESANFFCKGTVSKIIVKGGGSEYTRSLSVNEDVDVTIDDAADDRFDVDIDVQGPQRRR